MVLTVTIGALAMTIAHPLTQSPQFKRFEEYLGADPSDLPEGRFEYWDGELVPVMSESIGNDAIANFIFIALIEIGIPFRLIRPGKVEVVVPGRPRTRWPDLLALEEAHLTLLAKRATITAEMPPPRLLVEVVSPGNEQSKNYQRDYQDKAAQYAAIAVPEYWLVDPDRAWVQVGTLTNGAYKFRTFTETQRIASVAFPTLNLTAAQVLKADK
jgi:Uma2 family endonuclease